MQITASLVKELRDKTGAGMMDCKKALTECEGDIAKATDWLREKGMSPIGLTSHNECFLILVRVNSIVCN